MDEVKFFKSGMLVSLTPRGIQEIMSDWAVNEEELESARVETDDRGDHIPVNVRFTYEDGNSANQWIEREWIEAILEDENGVKVHSSPAILNGTSIVIPAML